MKRVLQILGCIAFLFTIMLYGSVILADEEISVSNVILYTADGEEIRTPQNDSNEKTITVEKSIDLKKILVAYGIPYTNGVVSGGAVTVKKDNEEIEITSTISVKGNGDNIMLASIIFNSPISLTEGNYDILLPNGCFVQDNIPTAETVIHIFVLPMPKDGKLLTPSNLVWNEDNTISWDKVGGADEYRLMFYVKDEMGKLIYVSQKYNDARNDRITLTLEQLNGSLGNDWKRVYCNFPFRDGETYYFSVQALSSDGTYQDSKIAYSEGKTMQVMTDESLVAQDLIWGEGRTEVSAGMKTTAIWRRKKEEQAFLTLYKIEEDGKASCVFTSRMTGDNFDINRHMTEGGSYYFEILPVVYKDNKQIFGISGRSAITTIGDEAAQKNKVDNILNRTLTVRNVEQNFNALMRTGITNVTEVLQNNKSLTEKYKMMESLYEKVYKIEVQPPVIEKSAQDLVDSSSIEVVGLALNAKEGGKPKLSFSVPETQLTVSEEYSNSVQLEIKVDNISTITAPVVITMKKPTGVDIKNLVILHYIDKEITGEKEDQFERLIPITKEGSDEITFVVSHFSTFVFANSVKNIIPNTGDTDYKTPTSSVEKPSSSSSYTKRNFSAVAISRQMWEKNGINWKYYKTDGSYAKNEWQFINGKWYYFNTDTNMVVGWKLIDNMWYYMDTENGDMKTNWQFINGKWYYMDANNGDMKVGWLNWNQKWFYLNEAGDMATGWQLIGSKWYYLTEDGACLINTVTPDGYSVDENGVWIE